MSKQKSEVEIYLEYTRKLALQIKKDDETLKKLKDNVMDISAHIDGERVQSSHQNKKAEMIDSIIDLSRTIESHLIEIKRSQAECLEMIYKVPNVTYQQVLSSYYVDCLIETKKRRGITYITKSWQDVAYEFGKTETWCITQCAEAKKEFEKIYKEKYR